MLQASCKEETEETLQRNLPKVEQASRTFPRPACPQTPGSPHAPLPLHAQGGYFCAVSRKDVQHAGQGKRVSTCW